MSKIDFTMNINQFEVMKKSKDLPTEPVTPIVPTDPNTVEARAKK
jgi:hypothetical protein